VVGLKLAEEQEGAYHDDEVDDVGEITLFEPGNY
jgi:hypothetical protein